MRVWKPVNMCEHTGGRALLWKRIMGSRVLSTTVGGTGSNVQNMLAYAHCSEQYPGGLALLLINTDHAPAAVDLAGPGLVGAREEYTLSPVPGSAQKIALNGRVLGITGNAAAGWAMPALDAVSTAANVRPPTLHRPPLVKLVPIHLDERCVVHASSPSYNGLTAFHLYYIFIIQLPVAGTT